MKVLTTIFTFTSMFVTSSLCFAQNPVISNYEDLLTALKAGHNVKGILSLHLCKSHSDVPTKEMVGSLNFNNFNAYELQEGDTPKKVIATSTTMLVESQQFGPVYNYVRLRVFADNTAEVFSEFLNPVNFTHHQQKTFTCHLSDSKLNQGITLYQVSQ